MKAIALAALLAVVACGQGRAWGPEGHSIVAEVAQRRLSPQAAAAVDSVLGRGHSLASIATWADDVREARKSTTRWHFVDMPIASDRYDPATQCEASPEGDCVIAELERLRNDLRCAPDPAAKQEALKFAVHYLGDIHQPLHTVADERGGNTIPVAIYMRGLACSQACKTPIASNFHAAWDIDLIHATVWGWGTYVDRLEAGWLKSAEAQQRGIEGGTPLDWALETHCAAQTVWNLLPANRVLDDAYYQKVLPVLDRQLGVAGLRLARFLNDAYASNQCPGPR